jgi:dUTPase
VASQAMLPRGYLAARTKIVAGEGVRSCDWDYRAEVMRSWFNPRCADV